MRSMPVTSRGKSKSVEKGNNVVYQSTSFLGQKVLGFRQANLPEILELEGKALSTDYSYRSI
jgi:hypothetical protein